MNITTQQNQPTLTRDQAEYIIRNSSDIINVKFFKKDGTLRSMNCRVHVKVGLSDNPDKRIIKDDKHITVYDMLAKGYRKINIDTIQSIKKYGVSYIVKDI